MSRAPEFITLSDVAARAYGGLAPGFGAADDNCVRWLNEGKKREARLYRGTTVIATVTSAEAKAQNSTPAGLASIWASRTKAALALPPLKISETTFKLPIGETRSIRVVGSAAWEAKVENSDPATVAALKTAEGFDIKTQKAGRVLLQAGVAAVPRRIERIGGEVFPGAWSAVMAGTMFLLICSAFESTSSPPSSWFCSDR